MRLTQQAGALAKALHLVLRDSLQVQNALGDPPRLYDNAPEDPVFPYLTYGGLRSEDIGADATQIASHQITVHVWSRYAGRAEVLALIDLIAAQITRDAINQNADIHICSVTTRYADVMRAADGRTHHGLLRLSFTTQPKLEEESL